MYLDVKLERYIDSIIDSGVLEGADNNKMLPHLVLSAIFRELEFTHRPLDPEDRKLQDEIMLFVKP